MRTKKLKAIFSELKKDKRFRLLLVCLVTFVFGFFLGRIAGQRKKWEEVREEMKKWRFSQKNGGYNDSVVWVGIGADEEWINSRSVSSLSTQIAVFEGVILLGSGLAVLLWLESKKRKKRGVLKIPL